MSNNIDGKETIELEGELVDDLFPYYDNTKGLKVKARFNLKLSADEGAEIEIIEKSKIYNDQVNGISEVRLLELMERIHHPLG